MNRLTHSTHSAHLSAEEMAGSLDGPLSREQRRHLACCPDCAAEHEDLARDVAAAAALIDGSRPDRGQPWAEELWTKLRVELEPYPAAPARNSFFASLKTGWPRLVWAGGFALALAAAFVAGRLWQMNQHSRQIAVAPPTHPSARPVAAPAPQPAAPPTAPSARPVVVVVLADHLDRSERLLVHLKHADLVTGDTAPALREEARQLLVANRIARRRAEADPALRSALAQLDTVLDRLANRSGDLSPAELSRLGNQLNADGLLFEVRVLRSRVPASQYADGTKEDSASEEGGIL